MVGCSDITNVTTISFYGGDKCSFATSYCGEDSLVNYERMIYCSDADTKPFAVSGLIVFLGYLIMLLASTADNFFVIELQTLSTMLQLSDDVAGVTLLALGNGAPDVFTAVVGLGQNDFQLALSDLMGGGIFINTVVLGSVILCTTPANLEVDRVPFLRDLGMYLLCTCAIFFFCLDGVVTMLEALGFIVVYLAYIVIVLVSSRSKEDGESDGHPKLDTSLIGAIDGSSDPVLDALMDGRESYGSYSNNTPRSR